MDHNPPSAWEPAGTPASPGPERFPTIRWRGLAWPIVLGFVSVTLLLVFGLPARSNELSQAGDGAFQSPLLMRKFPARETPLTVVSETVPGDLLLNGHMDDSKLGFYWRPPNHWIAGGWFEWFSREPFNFPEFNDGYERGFVHSKPSSQRLQLWGNDYAAGLMQSVSVTPCAYYRFAAYGQSRPGSTNPPPVEVASNMKVGLEPYGWMSGRAITNYDPGLEPDEFPDTVVWSPTATHNFNFAPYSVTAQALSNTMTVILFSYPEVDLIGGVDWNDTVWDSASLVDAQPPSGSLLGDAGLPKPDGTITHVTVFTLPHLALVEWDTAEPGSTQVLFKFVPPTTPISPTAPLTYPVYLPFVTNGPLTMEHYSWLDSTPVLHHRAFLLNLPAGYVIDFVALSQRFDGERCVTSASSVHRFSGRDVGGGVVHLPLVLRGE